MGGRIVDIPAQLIMAAAMPVSSQMLIPYFLPVVCTRLLSPELLEWSPHPLYLLGKYWMAVQLIFTQFLATLPALAHDLALQNLPT
jgi:hypothetical protein